MAASAAASTAAARRARAAPYRRRHPVNAASAAARSPPAAPPQRTAVEQERAELFAMLEPLLMRVIDLFHELDADGDGTLTADELIAGFERRTIRVPERQVRRLMSMLDANGDGEVSISEFMGQMRQIKLAGRAGRKPKLQKLQRERQLQKIHRVAVARVKGQTLRVEPPSQAEQDKAARMRRSQGAAWRAFERNHDAQLRWRRSVQSSSSHHPGRYLDVDPKLRGVPVDRTWRADLQSFGETHPSNPTTVQQAAVSLLAKQMPAESAAEIWDQSGIFYGGAMSTLCVSTLAEYSSLPEPEPEQEPRSRSAGVRIPVRSAAERRPASAPAVATTRRQATAPGTPSNHDLMADGNWHLLESEEVLPGVQTDTGGSTVWIGHLPRTCVREQHLLIEALEHEFGHVSTSSPRHSLMRRDISNRLLVITGLFVERARQTRASEVLGLGNVRRQPGREGRG